MKVASGIRQYMCDSIIAGASGVQSDSFSAFFSNGYIFDYFNNLLLVVMEHKMLQAITIYYFL